MSNLTLYDKLWRDHVVAERDDGLTLLYIDRHLVHEVTSPQAFAGLRAAGRALWNPASIVATADHNVPTTRRDRGVADIDDPVSRLQVETLNENCRAHQLRYYDMNSEGQGIVHIIGPERGATLPGMTVVCGDSHTSTHGALAALAMGIGTSEIEHVFATQCLALKKSKNLRVAIDGRLADGVSAKDLALALIGQIGADGGVGGALEYAGETVRALSMAGRMTLCNMAIEAGARAGLVAFDEVTADYVASRPEAPRGELLARAEEAWRDLRSDDGAQFDATFELRADRVAPQVTWGTSPAMVAGIDGRVPDPDEAADESEAEARKRALSYMGLAPDTPIGDIEIDHVFIGSCTNARVEDLQAAARVVAGRSLAPNVKQALVVPGSMRVKREAEELGLAQLFVDAGFEWREPGCSMCLGMNADRLGEGERCAATSNRNFEGRQGRGGRTHLVSPATAAAAAIAGRFVDVRDWS